ncbi:hypothetical protein B0H66DRAFT_528107 [Apodospora peruviana]|uniref:Uncharacterized protein n=1 Tax=Apodospora peruviana TaxID=516989 RepID=A0AAE0MFK9_9PEZI|nr:hypothetical protein B0H66DRAFT_528107 [Apodospora peruviana]
MASSGLIASAGAIAADTAIATAVLVAVAVAMWDASAASEGAYRVFASDFQVLFGGGALAVPARTIKDGNPVLTSGSSIDALATSYATPSAQISRHVLIGGPASTNGCLCPERLPVPALVVLLARLLSVWVHARTLGHGHHGFQCPRRRRSCAARPACPTHRTTPTRRKKALETGKRDEAVAIATTTSGGPQGGNNSSWNGSSYPSANGGGGRVGSQFKQTTPLGELPSSPLVSQLDSDERQMPVELDSTVGKAAATHLEAFENPPESQVLSEIRFCDFPHGHRARPISLPIFLPGKHGVHTCTLNRDEFKRIRPKRVHKHRGLADYLKFPDKLNSENPIIRPNLRAVQKFIPGTRCRQHDNMRLPPTMFMPRLISDSNTMCTQTMGHSITNDFTLAGIQRQHSEKMGVQNELMQTSSLRRPATQRLDIRE